MRRAQDPSTPPAQAPRARRRPHAWQPCLGEECDDSKIRFLVAGLYGGGSTDIYISHPFGPVTAV